MLNDFATTHQFEPLREDERNRLLVQMNSGLYPFADIDSTAHLESSSSNTISGSIVSTSSSSKSDHQIEQIQQYQQSTNINLERRFDQQHQHPAEQRHHANYCNSNTTNTTTIEPRNTGYTAGGSNKFDSIATSNSLVPTSSIGSIFSTTKTRVSENSSSIADMNINSNHHTNMTPTAHGSDHQMHYSQSTPKNLSVSSPSGMALNFSHDLLQQQTNHHILGSGGMHQHSDNNMDVKPQLHNSFELDSRSLMHSAVGMNMWKDMSQLNHFKHPAIADHNFLPASDLNTFSNWNHANNLNHQSSSMAHNILDGQHLISYSQHQQRSLPIPNQDLGSSIVKGQSSAEQTSFMLNSINHKASTSQNSSSNHQTTQPHDNLGIRSDSLDPNASYNLSITDNHLYNSSRSESRSQLNISKSSSMSDRSVHMSLSAHPGQLPYHQSNEAGNQQQVSHLMPSSSSGSSKGTGSFRCPHCNEFFPLRTVYQSHLKTHSQEKGKNSFPRI